MSTSARTWAVIGAWGAVWAVVVVLAFLVGAMEVPDVIARVFLQGEIDHLWFWRALDAVGTGAVVVPLAAVAAIALAATRRFWGAARILAVVALNEAAVWLLKLAFARERPSGGVVEATGFSMPSGHAATAAALAVLAAWFATRNARPRALVVAIVAAAAVWAVVMAASRLVLGVHYFSDVAAGLGVGVAVAGVTLAASVKAEDWARAQA